LLVQEVLVEQVGQVLMAITVLSQEEAFQQLHELMAVEVDQVTPMERTVVQAAVKVNQSSTSVMVT
jgi:hypothetical protein